MSQRRRTLDATARDRAVSSTPYILGHSPEEIRRLELQAIALEPLTTRLLQAAGLAEGMSVLDIGTGAGDVALLAGAIVGPSGRVLGLDRNAAALARAGARAADARLDWVGFEERDFDASVAGDTYDLVIGRYLLIHQPDPAGFVRRAAARVKDGGVIAFLEMAERHGHRYSAPPVASYEAAMNGLLDAFGEAGVDLDTGSRLVSIYADAGLTEPALIADTPTAGGSSIFPEWMARTVRAVCPLPSGENPSWQPLAATIRAAATATRSQLYAPRNVAAWARVTR